MSNDNFYFRMEKGLKPGLEFVILGTKESMTGEAMEAWILPSKGSNLCRLSVGSKNIIDFDPEQLKNPWYLGTPVLYPTPNRVMNGEFVYKGKVYPQTKRGGKVMIHGLVHDEGWQWKEPEVSADKIILKTWFDFKADSPAYGAFPFEHRLEMEFSLNKYGVQISYSVDNYGNKELPFGFALHPYFKKLSGESGTLISVPAESITECEPAYMPTGKLLPVQGTGFDLRSFVSVGSRLGIDNNYTQLKPGEKAEIVYKTLNMKVELDASDEFKHMVVYTPRDNEYFCLENQTCSINAHNVHAAGHEELSGLIMVQAGKKHKGFVSYLINKIG